MARLFGSDYHEHSNTWYFKEQVEVYSQKDITYEISKDETGKYKFLFSIKPVYNPLNTVNIKLKYNTATRKIEDQSCSLCSDNMCKHFLSVLNYAYSNLSTELLTKDFVVTYQASFSNYNEYWQKIKLNTKIIIQDLFDQSTDKFKVFFKNYEPFDIFLISQRLENKILDDLDIETIEMIEKSINLFSEDEINLIKKVNHLKCAVSRKGNFFSLYKKEFNTLTSYLIPLQNSIFIEETGEKLQIASTKSSINFQIDMVDAYNFILKPSITEGIQAFFPGNRSHFFKDFLLYYIDLPISVELQYEIFKQGYLFKRSDLVYIATVFSRQMSLIGSYVDLPHGVDIPSYYDKPPVIHLSLTKEKETIIIHADLCFDKDVFLPLNVLSFNTELIQYTIKNTNYWFYVPYSSKLDVQKFCQNIKVINYDQFVKESYVILETENDKDYLKKALFEYDHPGWIINISDDLKKEFIYRFELKPAFNINSEENINWFSYEIVYEHEDIKLTQDELRLFFRTKEKYYKTSDGKLIYIGNPEMYDEVENLIKKSKKDGHKKYKSSIYNLPWLYQMTTQNPSIRIYGDNYINQMYNGLLKRQLDYNPELSNHLKPVMRSYQKSGFYWLKMLEKFHLNGILADDMGLGKTLQALSVIASLPDESKTMIICPKTLLYNWANEIEKFCPQLSYIIYEGNKEDRLEMLKLKSIKLILISYAIVQNDLDQLKEINFDYVILDEAQHIKNPNTLRSKAIKKLVSRHKLALTGTPLENNVVELWSIFDFLMPGYLPTLRKFKNEMTNSLTTNIESKVQQYISPFILRRKKQEVLIELPDKQEQVLYCKMTTLQEKMYVNVIDSVRKDMELVNNQSFNYIHLLAGLTRLRQICDHPKLINSELKPDITLSGKTELLEEIIADAIENGKKILIFSQYIEMLKIIREILIKSSVPFEYMDGLTKDRHKVIDHFNNNEKIRAFLISLKTGGYGINLTSADTVILVDPWWNPMVENQAVDRAYRLGQTKKVNIYRIITKGTVEEKISLLQQSKRDLFEAVIEGGNHLLKNMNIQDIKNLFEYKE